ncbi:MAG: hypothetical protein IJT16_13805, partial [Lachnospiraceae bacterium]|nr:hypothetical protein [Lachnospiraceae bacterium]
MKITVLVCNSSFVLESVVRNGEQKELRAERSVFGLKKDLYLLVKNNGTKAWISWWEEMSPSSETEVSDDAVLPVRTRSGENLILLFWFCQNTTGCLRLFEVADEKPVSVGRAEDNAVSAPGLSFLSRHHLSIA